jgi:transcriptional regulator of NAD metabolism
MSPRARKASEAYLRCDSIELFAALQGYTVESARVAISRWRQKYGESKFPYKRPKSARDEITDITRLSQVWISHSAIDAAAILGFPSPGSLRSFIVGMRRQHGEKLFPLKRRTVEQALISDAVMRAASKLWKDKVSYREIVNTLDVDGHLLKQAIIEDRNKNGLQNFPYRGVLV